MIYQGLYKKGFCFFCEINENFKHLNYNNYIFFLFRTNILISYDVFLLLICALRVLSIILVKLVLK